MNLLDRASRVLVTEVGALRHAVREVRARALFHVDAWVSCCRTTCIASGRFRRVMGIYGERWRALKTGFSKALPVTEHRSAVRVRRGERGIWRRRF